ncbi:unnamed protein product, partial [Polarella glacialis]
MARRRGLRVSASLLRGLAVSASGYAAVAWGPSGSYCVGRFRPSWVGLLLGPGCRRAGFPQGQVRTALCGATSNDDNNNDDNNNNDNDNNNNDNNNNDNNNDDNSNNSNNSNNNDKKATRRGADSELPERTASGRPVSLDRLCRGWSIYQVADGYRFNHDDILLAREACRALPTARRCLDLGSGTGSVGLLWLAQQPAEATLTSLEAQEESVELCRRSLARLDLGPRARVRHGDLRDPGVLAELDGEFDLVTANPPYLEPGNRLLPLHPQRRYCYYEMRGGAREFAEAAR